MIGKDFRVEVDRVLKIMKQRERYVPDLTQPKRVNVKTWQSEIIELIRQGKITIEDVKNVAPEIAGQLVMDGITQPTSKTELPDGSAALEGEYTVLGKVDEKVPGESD